METKMKISIILLVISIFAFESILAKPEDRIRREFRKVELYIEKVEELTREYNNARATEYINTARGFLEQSRNIIFPISKELTRQEISEAARYLLEAKKNAQLASRLTMKRSFATLKVQLDELINQAEESVSRLDSDEAHYLLNQAKQFRQLAYDAFLSGNSAQGEEYYRIAFFFARKCVRFTTKNGNDIETQVIELEESIRQLFLRAQEIVTDKTSETLKKWLIEAEEKFEQAIQMIDRGEYRLALKQLKLIEKLLYRLFDQAERNTSTPDQRIENKLYSFRSLLQAIESDMENGSDKKVRTLLNKAREIYREAEDALAAGDYRKTDSKIKLGQRFANKILQLNKNDKRFDTAGLQSRLYDARQLLNLQLEQIEMSGKQYLLELHREGNRLLDQAQIKIDQQETEVAFQLIQAATRVSSRIQRELNRSGSGSLNEKMLEEKYNRLEHMITRLESNDEIMDQYSQIINQIRKFAEQGKRYLEQDNYILADEYLSTGLEQIRIYANKWKDR